MPVLSTWLGARPDRATLVNLALLSLILALVGSTSLFIVVGGGIVLAAGVHFVSRAAAWTFAPGHERNALQLALTWAPGILAIALALVGLNLAIASPPTSSTYAWGVALFAVQVGMLLSAGTDLSLEARGE